ncbi:hypothetical protein [Flaviaesturariibacter aridisoli]|uniref:Uncharacterized protein n=1 Tax=Flaviaesturariibacter aridisoli TaxID=2545761 RepID=A0A4R4DVF2_9BACT|nr:hypothetical protein [Flaviaesturariibacter aridisoli]TCZ65276.1 hypothetical protein E0486_17435 [Flaviaesturariibacter aridisoli]
MNERRNSDRSEEASKLPDEASTQELRAQESAGHSEQGVHARVDPPHDDDGADNKLSTSLDEDSAVK